MKKFLFLLLLSGALEVRAQVLLKGAIELKDSTINRSLILEIPNGCSGIRCSLSGFLTSGSLTVSLIDPKGNSSSAFKLLPRTVNPAKADFEKKIVTPMPGIWKLNIETRNGIGQFTYQIIKS